LASVGDSDFDVAADLVGDAREGSEALVVDAPPGTVTTVFDRAFHRFLHF
jgi:hypothetical protein